jgi:AAA+ superfamily predicted ATPase
MSRCCLYSNDINAKSVLFYACKLLKNVNSLEILPQKWFKNSSYIDYNEIQKNTFGNDFFILGDGNYIIEFENVMLQISVNKFIDNRKMIIAGQDHSVEIIKQVIITVIKQLSDIDDRQCIYNFIAYSRDKWNNFCENQKKFDINKVKKYIFNAECMHWEFMSETHMRHKDSLFLHDKDKLLDYVENFVKSETKDEYIKFNIPYKSNILLHGVAGSGKTSTCLVVASHLKTNLGVIPISRDLDDGKLIYAINGVKKNNCKVIIMEDIDCLFHDRKQHDTLKNSMTLSGILNCLDGLCRNEGIIVFLTTNNINVLDHALVRSSRIDLKIEYKFADELQTKLCFEYFCPNISEQFNEFYKHISHKQYTIANLQEFLFRNKCKPKIIDFISELYEI